MTITVLAPGAFTTIQDLGRTGWAAAGVPPSGAMDPFALRAANRLTGNDENAAALEITLQGPTLRFDVATTVAITGAPIDAAIDDTPVPMLETVGIAKGSTLKLHQSSRGLRAYLAIRGGIAVKEILGSRSTLVSAGIGGPLAAEDVLPIGTGGGETPTRRMTSRSNDQGVLRVITGPQLDVFTAKGRDTLFSLAFHVSPRSDRVGVRLEGEPIELATGADIDPEGVVTGAIQVPANGHPIILGPDRPVTGGYAKIGTVIAADLGIVAQARPGASLRFVETTVEQARAAWRERERSLDESIEDLP